MCWAVRQAGMWPAASPVVGHKILANIDAGRDRVLPEGLAVPPGELLVGVAATGGVASHLCQALRVTLHHTCEASLCSHAPMQACAGIVHAHGHEPRRRCPAQPVLEHTKLHENVTAGHGPSRAGTLHVQKTSAFTSACRLESPMPETEIGISISCT